MKFPVGENWYRNSGLAACPFTGIDEPCIEDGGYVKLREISVGYTFDQPWVCALARHEQRRASRRGPQPQDVDEVHGTRSGDDGRRRDVARRWDRLLQPAAHPLVRGDRQPQPLTERIFQ